MREERRVATVLAADLVDSTALCERLDPEDARLVLGEAVARMVGAVEDLGGTVKDVAGDGVLALFGAPLAHEDDPERAVRAGLRILEEIAGYGAEVHRGWGFSGFAARVGVNSGWVVLGPVGGGNRVEYGATGDAVNTASRLQTAAPPGGLLVGESTHRPIAALFEWGDPQTLRLKGKSEPVVAYTAKAPVAVPGKLKGRARLDSPLVGRGRELAAASEAVAAVLAGTGGVMFVTGEAGMGKSRMLMELRRQFEESVSEGGQPLWLEGRCASYSANVPYGPFRELLRDWLDLSSESPDLQVQISLRRATDGLLGDGAADFHPFLATILGLPIEAEAASGLKSLTPEALRRRTAEAVDTLLAHLSERGPVVVALDDLQWADATSIELADRLLALPDRHPILLVVAQRREREHESWRLRERALRDLPHRTREVALEPLPEEADERLLEALVGPETLPEGTKSRLLAAAGGNPFFLEELVRSLEDAGALVHDESGWRFDHVVEVEIPETVQKVILARLDRLPPASHSVLTAASVLGRQFMLPLLEAVADDDLQEPLHHLQRLDLVREARRWPEPEYRFKHPLIQETAYRSLVGSRRRELHRRAAQALSRLFPDRVEEHLGILAHHHREGGDLDLALEHLKLAGDAAARVYATEEALEHYAAALEVGAELRVGPVRIGELHLERGRVSFRSARRSAARSAYEAALLGAREGGDRRLELQTLEELGLLLATLEGRTRDAIPQLEDALCIAEDLDDDPARVSILNRLAVVHSSRLDFAEARRASDRAVALAGELDDERALARAMDGSKTLAGYLGDFESLRAILPQLEDILRRHEDLWYLEWVVFESALLPLAEARWEDARELMEEALALNRRIGDRANEPHFLAGLCWLHRAHGDYGRALAIGREASVLAVELDHPWWIGWSEALLGWTLLELNAVDDAVEHLERGLGAAERAAAPLYAFRCAGHLAWGQWLAGDRAAARAAADRAEQLLTGVTTPPGTAFLHGAHAALAAASVRVAEGRAELAGRLVSPLVEAAEQSGWQETMAIGSRVLGDCRLAAGDAEEAERLFRRALEVASGSGLPGEEWQSRLALAKALQTRGQAPEAADHLGRASTIVARLAAGIGEAKARSSFQAGAQAALAAAL